MQVMRDRELKDRILKEIGYYSKEARIERIAAHTVGEHVNSKKIRWQSELQVMKAYRIPLNLIRFNPYNGRIVVLSKENGLQESPNDPIENPEVQLQLVEYLWDVNPARNDETQKSLCVGQMEPAIITKDGILVDGNRRASLILKNRVENKTDTDYIEAVVLPVEYASEGRGTLEKLETSIQIGEDRKLDYGAIEKYIKVHQMVEEAGVPKEDVARSFGESVQKIIKWLSIMEFMDEYLSEIGAEGKYSRLANMEESFIEFEKLWTSVIAGRGVAPGVRIETRAQKDLLKKALFSVMRFSSNETNDEFKLEQKTYVRPLLMPDSQRSKAFLGKAEIVNEFLSGFSSDVLPEIQEFDTVVTLEALREEFPGVSSQELYKIRDERWCASASELSILVKRAVGKTQYDIAGWKPVDYVEDAFSKLKKVLRGELNGSIHFIDESTELNLRANIEGHEESIRIMARMADFLKREFV